ncbi:unnamed protein product [Rotaria magnacalcarata]|uniref:Uncharacterized protein n=2 Tax=Rotaria magnacalcarata TaxID=392030 RepID=A0A820H622_9BILA|nr:unnamed protein product [Rotaria magnacalcarata]CAF4288571.1 unnamed protein product [Rotaria magnacalcarata]
MTQKKDDLCDGINFQNTLEKLQVMDERNQPLSLKRHRTNGSEYQCDDNINLVDNDNENSYRQLKSSKYKRRNNYSRNDQPYNQQSNIHKFQFQYNRQQEFSTTRCGKDRNDKEDHNLCEIKCHHCDGPHTSTDYSCSFIQQYRREPVLELRNHPDLFPAEAAIIHTN